MAVRTLHCSNNIENYNICLDNLIAGFGHRGPLPNDKIYLLLKNNRKTLCGARFELDVVTDERPWEDSEKYVLCYSIKNIEYCNFFDLEFLAEIGGNYWTLKYLQGAKAFDEAAAKRLDEEFNKNRCTERQFIQSENKKTSKIQKEDVDELEIADNEIEEIIKEVPEAEIKIMGTFQTVNFQNETDKFKGLETLVNKNFFNLFTNYRAERTILIAKNRLFKTHQSDEISGISSIPDALLISFDVKKKLQISLVEYECYGDGKTRSSEKSKYLNSHIIPQLMQFASSFSIITDKSIRDKTKKDWIEKIIDYTSADKELSDRIDSWVKEMRPDISTRAIISHFEKELLEAFESNVHIFLIIDELSYEQKETIKNIITSFKVENGNTAVFDASVVKLVQKISFVDKDFEYALTAQ
ncbi:MAG: hypothetical protein SPK10_03960 [Treponema sp.]|nr:hypothetical protein [Treponema sp.]MDY5763929.1 hypothetical protein [Treponema sp.]